MAYNGTGPGIPPPSTDIVSELQQSITSGAVDPAVYTLLPTSLTAQSSFELQNLPYSSSVAVPTPSSTPVDVSEVSQVTGGDLFTSSSNSINQYSQYVPSPTDSTNHQPTTSSITSSEAYVIPDITSSSYVTASSSSVEDTTWSQILSAFENDTAQWSLADLLTSTEPTTSSYEPPLTSSFLSSGMPVIHKSSLPGRSELDESLAARSTSIIYSSSIPTATSSSLAQLVVSSSSWYSTPVSSTPVFSSATLSSSLSRSAPSSSIKRITSILSLPPLTSQYLNSSLTTTTISSLSPSSSSSAPPFSSSSAVFYNSTSELPFAATEPTSTSDDFTSSATAVSSSTSLYSVSDASKAFYYIYQQPYVFTDTTTTFTTDLPKTTSIMKSRSQSFVVPSSTVTAPVKAYKKWLDGGGLDDSSSSGPTAHSKTGTIVGSVVGSVGGVLLCAVLIWFVMFRRRKHLRLRKESSPSLEGFHHGLGRRTYNYNATALSRDTQNKETSPQRDPFKREFDFNHRGEMSQRPAAPPIPPPRKTVPTGTTPSNGQPLRHPLPMADETHARFSYMSSEYGSSMDSSEINDSLSTASSSLRLGTRHDSGVPRNGNQGFLREII